MTCAQYFAFMAFYKRATPLMRFPSFLQTIIGALSKLIWSDTVKAIGAKIRHDTIQPFMQKIAAI